MQYNFEKSVSFYAKMKCIIDIFLLSFLIIYLNVFVILLFVTKKNNCWLEDSDNVILNEI